MPVITTNVVGGAGENLTALRLEKDGYFNVYFLGEKAPIEDFLLEIRDEAHPYHCLLQVKSTEMEERYLKNGNIIFNRNFLNRRKNEISASALCSVRLSDDCSNLMACRY